VASEVQEIEHGQLAVERGRGNRSPADFGDHCGEPNKTRQSDRIRFRRGLVWYERARWRRAIVLASGPWLLHWLSWHVTASLRFKMRYIVEPALFCVLIPLYLSISSQPFYGPPRANLEASDRAGDRRRLERSPITSPTVMEPF
jgi:hypothetical protein